MRRFAFLFVLSLVLLLVSCTGNGPPLPTGEEAGGITGGGGGGGGGGAGGGGTGGGGPPPSPIAFSDHAYDLGVAGAFPSDLVRDGSGRLYTVDDAMVPCHVVSLTGGVRIPITASDLVDMDGTSPARAATTYGSGLFGAFTGDLEIAFDRWILVTVGAGNSLSVDGSGPLRLANLLVLDTATGKVVQTINLAWQAQRPGTMSLGTPYSILPQSLPVMCAFVPNSNATLTGRVYVALSNGAGSTAGLASFFEGTVQEWRADFTATQPLSAETAGRGAVEITRTRVTNHYNPVGLTPYHSKSDIDYLVLTAAGASVLDANYVASPTTSAHLEFLDLDTGDWRENLEVDLGATLPAVQRVTFGAQSGGDTFGLLTSQTFAAAYFVDLSGLDQNPANSARMRLLRTFELLPGGASTAGTGYYPGAGLTATSRTAVLSSFYPASLTILALPGDLEFGQIVANPAPFDTAPLSSAEALGLATLVVAPGRPEVHFIVNGNFDANYQPQRHGFIGTLDTGGRLP